MSDIEIQGNTNYYAVDISPDGPVVYTLSTARRANYDAVLERMRDYGNLFADKREAQKKAEGLREWFSFPAETPTSASREDLEAADSYYYIGRHFHIKQTEWDNREFDENQLECGNAFVNKHEAQQVISLIKDHVYD